MGKKKKVANQEKGLLSSSASQPREAESPSIFKTDDVSTQMTEEKGAADGSELKDNKVVTKEGDEEAKEDALKDNDDGAEKEEKEGEGEGEEEMEEEEIEDDSLLADRINENSYVYLIEQEAFAHVKSKIEGD